MRDETLQEAQARADRAEKLLKIREETLTEYYRVQQVLIAAGFVSSEKIEQAQEIVRGFS